MMPNVFYVTNTLTAPLQEGYETTYPEGSLSWALQQASAYTGAEIPTIVFCEEVAGKTLSLGYKYTIDNTTLYAIVEVLNSCNLVSEASRAITLNACSISAGEKTSLYVAGDLNVGEGIILNTDVTSGRNISLNNTKVSGTIALSLDSTLSGNNLTLTNETPFTLSCSTVGLTVQPTWDGTASSLREKLNKALPDNGSYQLSSQNPVLALDVSRGFTQDVTINDEWKAAILPPGFADLNLKLSITNGENVTLSRGCTIDLSGRTDTGYLNIKHGSLKVEAGARLSPNTQTPVVIRCGDPYWGNTTAHLEMNGADLTNTTILLDGSGSLELSNCWGTGLISLNGDQVFGTGNGVVKITGCDLSKIQFLVQGTFTNVIDLSGNYWGTDDPSAIMLKFFRQYLDGPSIDQKYFENNIIIGEILTTRPEKPNLTAPSFKLGKATLSKAAEGLVSATLSWTPGEDVTLYTLLLDGQKVELESDTATSCKLTTTSGEHSYTVIATNVHGNTTTRTGSFSLDASAPDAPELVGAEPGISNRRSGKARVSFNWAGEANEAAARYTVELVDGDGKRKTIYSGTKTSCATTLREGTYSYSITARDKAGNTSTPTTGSFSIDATAPTLILEAADPARNFNEGTGSVTFSWTCPEETGISYSLTLDKNKTPIAVEPTLSSEGTYTFTLRNVADGKHSYTLTATDAAGNSSTKKGSFSFDATAPSLTLNPFKAKLNNKGKLEATLSWKGEKGARYTLCLEGHDPIDMGTRTSYKCQLDNGAYSYYVIATDKEENVTLSATHTLRLDNEAPVFTTAPNHSMQLEEDGRASTTISWSCNESTGISYTVKVDGKTIKNARMVDDGNGNFSYTHTATLKAGKHSYSITATDQAGNKTTSKTISFTTPKLTLSKPKLGKGSEEGLMTAELKWNAVAGVSYTLSVDNQEAQTLAVSASGKYITQNLNDHFSDGTHCYRVVATDAAGNITVAEGSFSYDNTTPDMILGALKGAVVSSGKTANKVKATLHWAGEEGVRYSVNIAGKTVKTNALSVTTAALTLGSHRYAITATDKAGNTSHFTGELLVSLENGRAALSWQPDKEATLSLPEAYHDLTWQQSDTDGLSNSSSTLDTYRFTLDSARQLELKLSDLSADTTVLLQQEGGCGHISLAAHAATGLDRELSLSAGTYYLQVQGQDKLPLQAYTLDLELEKNGSKTPFQQAQLA